MIGQLNHVGNIIHIIIHFLVYILLQLNNYKDKNNNKNPPRLLVPIILKNFKGSLLNLKEKVLSIKNICNTKTTLKRYDKYQWVISGYNIKGIARKGFLPEKKESTNLI